MLPLHETAAGTGAQQGVTCRGIRPCPVSLWQRVFAGLGLGLLPHVPSSWWAAGGQATVTVGSSSWALRAVAVLGWLCSARSLYKLLLTARACHWVPRVAQLAAGLVPAYSFTEEEFFGADGAPAGVQQSRKAGMARLEVAFSALLGPQAQGLNATIKDGLSDIRFTDTSRVPPPFQRFVRAKLNVGTLVVRSEGPWLVDVDGNKSLDISGSYGVNVCGYERYKLFVSKGMSRTQDLGPNVLGPLHPIVCEVIPHLKRISGLDEVSFHMSGTEAMMCAVRLCRFNTRRPLTVQFSGAYHGWWDGVQPGPGNERAPGDVLNLRDMSPASLALIRSRASEIACVCVSPLQGLNPNNSPPSDMVLMDAKMRSASDSVQRYAEWLRELRQVCTSCQVPLVFDEVYTGFRMARGGAQQYFGVQADLVVYGKTLGGGLASGVCCGRSWLMRRFDPEHPLRVAYVIGTFSASPALLGPMAEFLAWLGTEEAADAYQQGQRLTDEFISGTNAQLLNLGFPLRVQNLTTVWTVLFTQPGRYHWIFQYYLRAEGVALSWVGTGRCLFSLDFSRSDYEILQNKILAAAGKMRDDGWWWDGADSALIKRRMAKEVISAAIRTALPFFNTRDGKRA
ncbi:unnamed protein product [Polarella glacialis]|uniref:Glutamate-1-semialdehyde 2,1-aminomutase n=1 Tax=Polarella glacialis TaxID=89957 RepID=A0A813DWA9_POLGL|nr:unnamed protein product [Polarella glacialis]